MPKGRDVYFDECRFTDRSLDIVTHGHGIKLSIRTGPAKGEVVSVFLDAGQTSDLLVSLYEANTPSAPPVVSREVATALSNLTNALHRAGF
jgi:hypothetical protein